MLISLNITLDLSLEEIGFLQRYYVDNRTASPNGVFFLNRKDALNTQISNLISWGIITADSIHNLTLTKLGNLVCDQLDREMKIDFILGHKK